MLLCTEPPDPGIFNHRPSMRRPPLTSFAAAPCEPERDCSRPNPHHRGLPDPPPPPPRQRQTASPNQDAFHRRVPCTPWPCFRTTIPACAGLPPRLRVEAPHAFTWNGDDEETIACVAETPPATNRLRCSRARGLRHRDPVPAPLHPPSLSLRRAGELDPLAPCLRAGRGPNAARRLLQYKQSASTTCESTDPHVTEHPELTLARSARLTCFRPRGPEPPPDPRLAPGTRLPLRGAPKAPPGSRPPSRGHGLRRELGRGWLLLRSPFQHHPGSCDPERSHWRVRSLRQPRSHGPGANGFRHRHLPQRAARRHARAGASPQPDPLGHLLSWHRRLEPEGDSDLPCDPTEGRITRPSAKKAEIRRTRGAFHR